MEIDLEVLTSKLDELKDQEARLKHDLKETEKHIEKLELQLQAVLTANQVEYMQFGTYSFGWKTSQRNSFNQKLFSAEHPDLYDLFKTTTEIKKFEFKVGV